ncbi:MAG: class I SAM-dependent methyltransferase [Candidatus Doudnabacteria bacterium]|nr:class I SAM-dependent methyltransferase [Candidatus Doudnabacteria bacterium]
MNPYNDKQTTAEYLHFLNSENGQIQQDVLSKALEQKLEKNNDLKILDAACGSGWLTKKLSEKYPFIEGCDSAVTLIEHAKVQYPNVKFSVANLQSPLPYTPESFNTIILNMAATDLSKLEEAYKNLETVLKPNGQLLVTIPNPMNTYPFGIWKRSLIDRLLFRKPQLFLRPLPYNSQELLPSWNASTPTSRYYSLEDHINSVTKNNFALTNFVEIRSDTDSPKFNLQYQLYRYPLLLLLEFKKTA